MSGPVRRYFWERCVCVCVCVVWGDMWVVVKGKGRGCWREGRRRRGCFGVEVLKGLEKKKL